MAQVELRKQEFREAGAQVVFIAAEKRAGLFKPESYLREHPVSFPFLLDEDRAVTKAYGVYHRIGLDAINIAHPATFVVDRHGVIRGIHVGASQTDRAALEDMLAVARTCK